MPEPLGTSQEISEHSKTNNRRTTAFSSAFSKKILSETQVKRMRWNQPQATRLN